jgi:SAM-dependent methyltransferase
MYLADACPCCGSERHAAYPALTSPFLAAYVLERPPEPVRLLECEGCGFRFFESRLTDAENERLYAGYRGERYYRERHRREPWYTRKVNDAIGGDPEILRGRRELVERFVRTHAGEAADRVESVLDFGGDRGQVIPEGLGREKFVYEISGTHPVAGVTRIGTTEELASRRFDLVLLCHVLEHCSDPGAVLGEVRALLRPGALLYVELPFERADLRFLSKRARYASYLRAIRRVPPLLTALDFYSTLVRTRLRAMPPLGFVKMHEHVNFFDAPSLRALFDRCGLETVACETIDVPSPLGPSAVLAALARAGVASR